MAFDVEKALDVEMAKYDEVVAVAEHSASLVDNLKLTMAKMSQPKIDEDTFMKAIHSNKEVTATASINHNNLVMA